MSVIQTAPRPAAQTHSAPNPDPASPQTPHASNEPGLLRQFFAYYKPHRALFVTDFGCAVVSGLLELGLSACRQVLCGQTAARSELGAYLGLRRRPADDLSGQHRLAVCRQLLGARFRHFH